MKILALSPRPVWPMHDGATVATVRCLSGLAAAGAEVTLLSMRTEKHPLKDLSGTKQPHQYLSNYNEITVSTRISPPAMLINLLFSDKPYDLTRFRSKTFSSTLASILNDSDFDLIHCEGLVFALYLDEIRKHTGVPVILRAHNLEHKIRKMMAESESSPFRKAYLLNLSHRLLKLEREAALMFDALVPISKADSQWFSAVAPEKPLFVSMTGTDEVEYIPEPETGSLRVGFIGSMDWQPNAEGINWFIESVWPLVLEKVPGVTLHVAGRGLRHPDGILSAGKDIFCEGEPDDARNFMASNHVMISPLFTGSGIRIKIIEAMSTGRPVVATTVAVAGLIAENGRELTVADDAGSFSDALVKYLANPELRYTSGHAATELVRREYDNRTLTAQLLEFYEGLTRGS